MVDGFLDSPYGPRWSFGEGLSYTRFVRSNMRADVKTVTQDGAVRVSLDVTNAGDRDGAETIFLLSAIRRARHKACA